MPLAYHQSGWIIELCSHRDKLKWNDALLRLGMRQNKILWGQTTRWFSLWYACKAFQNGYPQKDTPLDKSLEVDAGQRRGVYVWKCEAPFPSEGFCNTPWDYTLGK